MTVRFYFLAWQKLRVCVCVCVCVCVYKISLLSVFEVFEFIIFGLLSFILHIKKLNVNTLKKGLEKIFILYDNTSIKERLQDGI